MATTTTNQSILDERYVLCVLYYLVADADSEVKPAEIEKIEKKMDQLFAIDSLTAEQKAHLSNKIRQYAVGRSDEHKREAVKYFSERVSFSHETFIIMMADLEEIANCDGRITIEEHSLMFYIRLKFRRNYKRSGHYDTVADSEVIKLENQPVLSEMAA